MEIIGKKVLSNKQLPKLSDASRIKAKPTQRIKTRDALPKIAVDKHRPRSKVLNVSPPVVTAILEEKLDPARENRVELPIHEKAKLLLASPAMENSNCCGKVFIRFNHYNKPFPIHNGVLLWKSVDDEYSFSFVYKGAYRRDLIHIGNPSSNINIISRPVIATTSDDKGNETKSYIQRDSAGDYFLGLENDQQYLVEIEEDPIAGVGAEGLRLTNKPLLLSQRNASATGIESENVAMKSLTMELKAMTASSLQGQEARDIIERRDLEDILYNK